MPERRLSLGGRITRWTLTAGLVACTPAMSEAERAEWARSAPDLDEALAACPASDRHCGVDVVGRFGAWERCAELTDPADDECRFRQAEGLERAGDGAGALALCASTIYEVGCATHVVGQEARRAETMVEAVARWEAVMSHTKPRFNQPYWRAWWRSRIDAGSAEGIEACPDEPCRRAGAQEMEATVDALEIPCAAADREPPGWVAEGSALSLRAWTEALSHLCIPDANHPVPRPRQAPPPPPVRR
jgi:hypothetical protein